MELQEECFLWISPDFRGHVSLLFVSQTMRNQNQYGKNHGLFLWIYFDRYMIYVLDMVFYIFLFGGSGGSVFSRSKNPSRRQFSASALNTQANIQYIPYKATTTKPPLHQIGRLAGGRIVPTCHFKVEGETCLDSSTEACPADELMDGRVQSLLGLYCWSSGVCCPHPKWRRLCGQLQLCQVHQRKGRMGWGWQRRGQIRFLGISLEIWRI